MALNFEYGLEDRQTAWSDMLKEVIRHPERLDKMGSADLKRVGKGLAITICKVGERAAKAEQALEDQGKAENPDLIALKRDYDLMTARNIELTGGRPPEWSYLYKANIEVLHHYIEFVVKKNSKQATVFGILEGDVLKPLYDFDYKGMGVSQATGAARLMAVHLRQCFVPRELREFEEV